MRLSELLANESVTIPPGLSPDDAGFGKEVTGLFYDSREVENGGLFFALPGIHTNGAEYLASAEARGAAAAITEGQVAQILNGMPVFTCDNVRSMMSRLSSRFYHHPSRELCVIGVTGTDGKSSTVSFISQLLEAAGFPSGYFSTVSYKDGPKALPNTFRQSTPEAPQIHGLLRTMKTQGIEYAVLESTSHGLSPKTSRLADVIYKCAVFTNVTQEHLEFHGTLEQYRADKARLFTALDRGPQDAFGGVNADDPHHKMFIEATRRPVRTYSIENTHADLWAGDIQEDAGGLTFTVGPNQGRGKAALAGRFNVSNILAALLAVSGTTGTPVSELLPLLDQIQPVKGRMNRVAMGQPFEVLIDYAHTPGAFESLFPPIRSRTKGKLWVVFGSGGERDRVKRPVQGGLADTWCDKIILTDEDPRLENPETILDDIQSGIKKKTLGVDLFRLRPRRDALRFALAQAQEGDTLLFLGKGHEASILGPTKEAWDEEAETRKGLEELGWRAP